MRALTDCIRYGSLHTHNYCAAPTGSRLYEHRTSQSLSQVRSLTQRFADLDNGGPAVQHQRCGGKAARQEGRSG
jgi:phage gp46-like protein